MHFCSYFDENYLPRAKVCHHTLMKHSPDSTLWIMAMDDRSYEEASSWKNTRVFKAEELEAYKPDLLRVKPKRQPKEYYATMTPVLPQYIFDTANVSTVWYTDADMAFFAPVEEMESVLGDHSVLVTPHEHPHARPAGLFNVGILGYKNDEKGRIWLRWWEDRCMEWCEWRATKDGKCADQGYLNILAQHPERFNAKSSDHAGINLGPWNLALHKLEQQGDRLILDGSKNLVSYHYHGFKRIGKGQCENDTGWEVSPENFRLLYQPYVELLDAAIEGKLA